MAKKYMSEHTRSRHTYKFFKDRRNDPEWQEDFYEVRRLHWHSIFVRSCAGALVIAILCVIAFLYVRHSNDQSETSTSEISNSNGNSSSERSSIQEQYSTNQKSSSISSNARYSQSSESSSMTNSQRAQKYLLNKSYSIVPIQFNGEDVDAAMNENKAPQNTVHDNRTSVTFKSSNTATERGSMGGKPWTGSYTISDSTLTIDGKTFPYTITNGTVSFGNYVDSDPDGNKYTFAMQPN